MNIFLVGGGTGGPTTPLLAVAEALRKLKPATKFFLITEKSGVREELLKTTKLKIELLTIPAGKWRRYFSFKNIIDIFKIICGFFKSLILIKRYHPSVVFGAGSFVQVPMAWAAFFLKVPFIAHQQDLRILLSTRLVAPVARAVTTAFEGLGKSLPCKTFWTGNPIRHDLLTGSAIKAKKLFSLNKDYPTILVMGGGTGSAKLNKVILESLPELTKYVQIIHSTGNRLPKITTFIHPHYHRFDFLGSDLKHAYAIADLVIGRGGMSTITELSRLGKVSLLIPLPNSAQEDNVRLLVYFKCAVGIAENILNPDILVAIVRKMLWSKDLQSTLQRNIKKLMPKNSDEQIAKLLISYAK